MEILQIIQTIIEYTIGIIGVLFFTLIFVSAFLWHKLPYDIMEYILKKIWGIWDFFWRK